MQIYLYCTVCVLFTKESVESLHEETGAACSSHATCILTEEIQKEEQNIKAVSGSEEHSNDQVIPSGLCGLQTRKHELKNISFICHLMLVDKRRVADKPV